MNSVARKIILLVAAAAATLTAVGCAANPIMPSEFDQTAPAISGPSVVWEDSRAAETSGVDLYTSEWSTGLEDLVVGTNGDQEQPAISSSYIVWIDGGRLRAKDRATGAVFSVTTGPATQNDPVLCGSVVAWTDTGSGNADVYARDLAGGTQIAVATSSAVEGYPACDNGRVVYMYAPTAQFSSIRLFDLASRTTTVVASDSWNDWRPAISGDRVVWQAWPNQPDTVNGIQIMGKSLSTGATFTVTSGPGHQLAPVISGTAVAWEDSRSGQVRVWWRDLTSTTPEQEVDPTQPGRQQAPALSGRLLAFQSDATGVWNVYTVPILNQATSGSTLLSPSTMTASPVGRSDV